jgi:hypothetical protein
MRGAERSINMIKTNLRIGDIIVYQSEFATENFVDNTGKMIWRPLRTVYKIKEVTRFGVICVRFDKWLKSKWTRTRVFFSFKDIERRYEKGIPFLKIENEIETEIA